MWTNTGTIFARILICAPLLYVFLLMVIDPASFVKFSETLARVLRTFEHRFHGVEWGLREPELAEFSKKSLIALRLAGLALAVCVFLYLAGIAD